MRDRHLVFAAGFLRGLAAGLISVLAAVYLAKRGFPAAEIGLVLTAGLAGIAVGTVYGTFLADRVGRRRSLVGLSILTAAGGFVLESKAAILASFATGSAAAVTVALAHLSFNVMGVAIFYPLRALPIWLARQAGAIAGKSKGNSALVIAVYIALHIIPIAYVLSR